MQFSKGFSVFVGRASRVSRLGFSVAALICFSGCTQLNPDFTADLTGGHPGLEVTFTNTSTVGTPTGGAKAIAGTADKSAPRIEKPRQETKAPSRTSPRTIPLPTRFSVAFSLDPGTEVPVGNTISAVNASAGADVSEWEVRAPDDTVIFPPDTDPDAGRTRNLPEVMLESAGIYEVTLRIQNTEFGATDSLTQTVRAGTQVDAGTEEEAVYIWDFGDGTAPREIGADQPVVHTYAALGTYTVSLTMRQGGQEAIETKEELIRIFETPESMEFQVVQQSGGGGAAYAFTDLTDASENDPIVTRIWDFGDGETTTTTGDVVSVNHTYTQAGVYTVSLTVVTQNGGESMATRTDVVQVVPSGTSIGPASFDIENYFPLEVGNRWVYRSTGSTSYVPFHFALSVVAETEVRIEDAPALTVYTVAVQDSLDRNFEPEPGAGPLSGGFLLTEIEGALYAFRDQSALDLYVREGQFEAFYAFPIANGNIAPMVATLFDPQLGVLTVDYEEGALSEFLPDLLTEAEYRAIVAAAKSAEKQSRRGGLAQPSDSRGGVGKRLVSSNSSGAKSLPAATKGTGTEGAIAIEDIGVGDQPNSIALVVDDVIPYVFSEGVGITYLVGSALTGFFPFATLGPGSQYFAVESTFTLEWALVGGEIFGEDDHNDISDPVCIFRAGEGGTDGCPALEDAYPTLLLPNFGALPGHLSGADVDVFYISTQYSEQGITYELAVAAVDGVSRLRTDLIEFVRGNDGEIRAVQGEPLSTDSFTQREDGSEFLLRVTNPTGSGEIGYTVELTVGVGEDMHGDDPASATPIAVGGSLRGILNGDGDVDVFRFDAVAGATYSIETSSASFSETDTSLTLLDANGNEIAFDDDSGFGLFSLIVHTATTTGPLFAVVSGFDDGVVGPYTISIISGATSGGEDDHANNVDDATPLTVNGPEVAGNLEQFGDFDEFTFEAQAGQTYEVLTTSETGTDTFIFVFDADYLNGTEPSTFFFDDDGNGRASRVVFTAAETESIFVEVQGFQGQVVGRYGVSVREVSVSDDFEGTQEAATPIAVDGPGIAGELQFSGDVDAFVFDAVAGETYLIVTSGDLVTDTVLDILNGDGDVIAGNDDADGTVFSAVTLVAQETGPLSVFVSGYANTELGPYRLDVLTGANIPDDHGDDLASATAFVVGTGPVIGTFETNGDIDVYALAAESGQTFSIDTFNTTGDTILEVFDGEGNSLAFNDDTFDLLAYVFFQAPATDMFFVAVSSFGGESLGDYGFLIREDDHGDSLDTARSFEVDGPPDAGELELEATVVFGDFDVFEFEIVTGTDYVVRTTTPETESVQTDTQLVLFDDTGAVVAENDDESFPAILTSAIEFTATYTGLAIVRVQGFDENTVGQYEISITTDE